MNMEYLSIYKFFDTFYQIFVVFAYVLCKVVRLLENYLWGANVSSNVFLTSNYTGLLLVHRKMIRFEY